VRQFAPGQLALPQKTNIDSASWRRALSENTNEGKVSRRNFLEIGSAAIAAAGVTAIPNLQGQEQNPQNQPGYERRKSDPGPTNSEIDAQNQSSFNPLETDAGGVPPFKYPFSFSHKRLHSGGWSREVTVRELPVSKTMAGVDMRLTAGGVRELHWHTAAEWAFMLYGNARITGLDNDGKGFVADVKENDLWYFPTGCPHSIQGLNPDGAEFLLVFDDGNFSEYATVLLSDWMAHTPKDVLAKNFGIAQPALEKLPPKELFIFQSKVPGPLEADLKASAGTRGLSPLDFSFRTSQAPIYKKTKGGEVLIIDSRTFKVSTTIASAIVTVKPGGVRELHWHQNADEWQYFISGKARQTIFATGGRARTMNFQAGDVGYIEKTLPHYVENIGNTDLKFLEMFKANIYQDLSLSEWLAHTPAELVMAHMNIDRAAFDAIPRDELVVMPL
jgi:oxalate decarboxylase